MTTDQAQELANEFQERASQIADSAESTNLRKAATAIRDLACQLDDVDGLTDRIATILDKRQAEAAAVIPAPPDVDQVTEDIAEVVEPVNDKKPRKREKLLSE